MAALLKILSNNSETEIGRRWDFETISTVEDFWERLPLTTYPVYQPYIERMAEKGEENLITMEKTNYFAPYSGTPGKVKLFPVSDATFRSHIPPPDCDTRSLLLVSLPENADCRTQSGLPIKTLSVGEIKYLAAKYPNNHSVPLAALNLTPATLGFYIQLVFGLKDNSINEIVSSFITTLHTALLELTSNWAQIVQDIETGQFHQSLPISANKRKVFEGILGGPDPVLANKLRVIFEKAKTNSFEKVLSLIWPKLRVIKCLCSGSLSSYIPKIKHYTSSNVHVLSFMYVCSEGLIGLPAKPSKEASLFHLIPHNFYEFIPLSSSCQDQPKTLLPHEVEVGKVYEIVMTTSTGVYRYRNGDCIKVMEQGESGPLIDFYGRRENTLNLREHILYEANFNKAMTAFTGTAAARVDCIVSVDDTTFSRYRVWIECAEEDARADLDVFLDAALQEADDSYKYEREHGKLEQLIVCHVKHGTFSLVLQHVKTNQHPLPHMITMEDKAIYDILSNNLLQ